MELFFTSALVSATSVYAVVQGITTFGLKEDSPLLAWRKGVQDSLNERVAELRKSQAKDELPLTVEAYLQGDADLDPHRTTVQQLVTIIQQEEAYVTTQYPHARTHGVHARLIAALEGQESARVTRDTINQVRAELAEQRARMEADNGKYDDLHSLGKFIEYEVEDKLLTGTIKASRLFDQTVQSLRVKKKARALPATLVSQQTTFEHLLQGKVL